MSTASIIRHLPPRRYRRHDRPLSRTRRRSHHRPRPRRHHAHASYRRRALGRRRSPTPFRPALWQFTLTATDANRFSIRIAREITQRPKILVFHYCYHGTVDESYTTLENGVVGPRRGNIGPPVNPVETTRVVEFNDLAALEAALAHKDVACILAEPVLTNVGIVLPEPGYWEKAAALARKKGTLLIIDETHTSCTGPGGYTHAHGLKPDIFVVGKPIASGVPAAAYGMSAEIGERVSEKIHVEDCDTGGIGGTLAANALSLAAMRATLDKVLTAGAFWDIIPAW